MAMLLAALYISFEESGRRRSYRTLKEEGPVFELRHSAPRRDCEMLRRVLFLGILGAATCLSSVPAGSRSLPVQRLRGGGEFRFVDVGVANDETLRNEPFSQSVSSSEESAGSYGSSGE